MDETVLGTRGRFIVFEGIDGAGTTTQIERYASHLRKDGWSVHVTREPSNGPIGVLIRQVLTRRLALPEQAQTEIMALLFAADRLDHVHSEIESFMDRGFIVLSDRYDLSSMAYQSISASEDDTDPANVVDWIRALNRDARRPDVTLVVNVTPVVAASRREGRGADAELFEADDLQSRLAEAYAHAEILVPDDVVVHVNGDGTTDEVTASIIRALAPYIKEPS